MEDGRSMFTDTSFPQAHFLSCMKDNRKIVECYHTTPLFI